MDREAVLKLAKKNLKYEEEIRHLRLTVRTLKEVIVLLVEKYVPAGTEIEFRSRLRVGRPRKERIS